MTSMEPRTNKRILDAAGGENDDDDDIDFEQQEEDDGSNDEEFNPGGSQGSQRGSSQSGTRRGGNSGRAQTNRGKTPGRGGISKGKGRAAQLREEATAEGTAGGSKRGKKKKGRVKKSKYLQPRNAKSSIASLPNFHTSTHAPSNSRRFGSSRNVTTSVGEMQHQLWKALVLSSNLLDLDLVFCKHANVLGAIRAIIDRSHPKKNWPKVHPWEENLRVVQDTVPELFTGYALGQIARKSGDDEHSRNTRGAAAKLRLVKLQR